MVHHQKNKKQSKGKTRTHGFNDSINEVKPIRKPMQPNWEHQEIVAFLQGKQNEHIASLDVVDSLEYFENTFM
jgi:hypothetical protein